MKIEWKDESAYSAGERGKVEPTSWQARISSLTVTVHRVHSYDGWCGSCYELGSERVALRARQIEEAKDEFVSFLIEKAEQAAVVLRSASLKQQGRR